MKKLRKFVSFILVLAILAGAGYYACQRFGIDLTMLFGNRGGFGGFIEAVNYSKDYNGSITVQRKTVSKYSSGDEVSNTSHTEVVSYDKLSKIGYYLNNNEDGKQESGKIFAADNTYYYEEHSLIGSVSTYSLYTYENFFEKYGEYALLEYQEMDLSYIFSTHLKGLHLATSLDELKEAYATVFETAVSNTQKFAQLSDDLYFSNGTTQYEIDFDKRFDSTVLTIDVIFEAQGFDDGKHGRFQRTTAVTVKGGVVTEIDVSISTSDSEGERYQDSCKYTFDYSFDAKGYEKIERHTSLDFFNHSVLINPICTKFKTTHITHNDEWISYYNADKIVDSLRLTLADEYSGCGEVRGLYVDANMLTEITNDNFNIMDLMEIEYIYADVEIYDDYAAIRSRWTNEDRLSLAFKIVLGDNWLKTSEQSSRMTYPQRVSKNALYQAHQEEHLEQGVDYIIKVNGEVLNGSSFVLVGGEEYYVEYICNVSDGIISLDSVYESFIEYGY